MSRRPTRTAAALAAALLLAACGGDAGGPAGPDGGAPSLSQADLAALNEALLATGSGVGRNHLPTAQRAPGNVVAADASTDGVFSFSFAVNVPCQPSGSVDVAGTVAASWSASAATGQLQTDFSLGHRACAVATDDGGTIVLTGEPDVDVRLAATSLRDELTAMRLTEQGAFSWRKGSSEGRCTVDLTADWVPGTSTARLSGHFCGWRVDGQTVPVG